MATGVFTLSVVVVPVGVGFAFLVAVLVSVLVSVVVTVPFTLRDHLSEKATRPLADERA